MNCFLCSKWCHSFSDLFSHFRHLHGLPSNGCEVRCTYSNCPRVFLSFHKLKDHALSQHKDDLNCELSAVTDVHKNDDNVTDSSVPCSGQIEKWPEKMEINVQQSFMRFITTIGSKPGVSMTVVQNVAEELSSLVHEVKDFAVRTVHEMCNQLSVAHNDPCVSNAIGKLNGVPEFLNGVDTQHKRNKWLLDNGYLVQPVEVVLGTRTEQRYSSQLRRNKLVIAEDTFQYIPLDKLLSKILENPAALNLMQHYKSSGMAESPRMHDFIDTDTFKNNSFFVQHPDAFIIHLFIDAFETVNVLGSHTTVHKLEGLYCVLRNVPTMYLSKMNSIFLVGLWHSLDVKRYGYDKILTAVVKQLSDLESEKGLTGTVFGKSVAMHGIVVAFSADNLGAHSLFGYLESFSANRMCRFCLVHKSEIQEKFHEKHFTLRTADIYDEDVKKLKDANYSASQSGVKRDCILNSLRYFHCTEQSVPDCMHDICEGVGPYELELILQSLIDRKIVTLDFINQRIFEFNYSMSDKNSKPPELSLPHVRLQAAECWCLLRNLPLMIASSVPRGDPFWQLLISLLDCMAIIFAPVVTANWADFLSYLVEDHLALFKSIYPDKPLLPKHHFLVHYGSQMKVFGPLVCYWCMRFEAKHRFGKEVSSVCRNFKNICKTIANRNQQKLANDLLNQTLFKPLETTAAASNVVIHNLEDDIADTICSHFGFERSDEIYVASSCQLGHYSFKPGCYAVLDVVEGLPKFGEILLIICVMNENHLVLKCNRTIGFDEHYYADNIEEMQNISIISLASLLVIHPLACHNIEADGKEMKFINTRYKLF